MSRETDGLIGYLTRQGVPFKVTDINTPGVHTATSYHYRAGTGGIGLAVDFAFTTPTQDSPQLLAIFGAFSAVKSQLAELIYSGAPYSIKNGKVTVTGYGDPAVLAAHHNHVHVAVPYGTFLAPSILPEDIMPDDPNLPNITGPVEFHPLVDSAGHCTGYYIFSNKTGELHSFGPGAQYYGRSEVVA